jgi:hypothetical protein
MICVRLACVGGGSAGYCRPGCQSASDCGVDMVCGSTSRCVAKTCTTAADCSASFDMCDSGQGCVGKSCAGESDCSGGHCVNGVCGSKAGKCVAPVQ